MSWRSSKSCISVVGTADPPQITRRRLERSHDSWSAWRSRSIQMVGTAAERVTRSSAISAGQRGRGEVGARHDHVGAGQATGVGHAPRVRVEHRHHRHDAVVGAQPEGVGQALPEGVQHVRPVRVENALRVARGAARVAEARGLALVELGVLEAGLGGGQQLLVVQGVRQRSGVPVAHHHVVADRLEARRQLLEERARGSRPRAPPSPRRAPRCTRSGRRTGARSACGARRPCRARPGTPPGARACSRRRWPRARPASRPGRPGPARAGPPARPPPRTASASARRRARSPPRCPRAPSACARARAGA